MKGIILFFLVWIVACLFDVFTQWDLFEAFVIVILGFLFIEIVEIKKRVSFNG